MDAMVVKQPVWTTVPHRVRAVAQEERLVLPVQPVHRVVHPHVPRPVAIPAWPHQQEAAVRIVLTNAPTAVHRPVPAIVLQVVPRRVRQPVPTLVRDRLRRVAPIVPLIAVAAATAVALQVVVEAAAVVAAVAAHQVAAVSVIIHVQQDAVGHAIENVEDHVVVRVLALALRSVSQAARVDARERVSVRALHLAQRRVAMDVIRHADPLVNTKEKPLSYLFYEVR